MSVKSENKQSYETPRLEVIGRARDVVQQNGPGPTSDSGNNGMGPSM